MTKALNALLAVLLAALFCFSAPTFARAQDYPNKVITIVVPFAAGGLTDVPIRLLAGIMQENLGVPIVVENRTGASGMLGASQVLRANPDGYTLLATSITDVLNLHYMKIPYDAVNDFAHIARVVDGPPLVLIVTAAHPYKAVADLVADAKANSAKLSFATSGPATSPMVALNQLNAAIGAKIQDVPYRGAGEVPGAVMTGAVQGAFTYYSSAKSLVESKQLRVLAVAARQRIADWPDVPTLNECGLPGIEHNGFVGLAAPANTPPAVVAFLNKAVNAAINTDLFRSRMAALAMTPPDAADNTSPKFKAFMQARTAREAELAKLADHSGTPAAGTQKP